MPLTQLIFLSWACALGFHSPCAPPLERSLCRYEPDPRIKNADILKFESVMNCHPLPAASFPGADPSGASAGLAKRRPARSRSKR